MICQSCGANSSDINICEYCSSRIKLIDTSNILLEEESRKAQILELGGDLSYVYNDKENLDQVLDRLIEKVNAFIESKELKKAEFFSQLAIKANSNDERSLFASALVKVEFAAKTTGSIQMANIKQKYLAEAKKLLDKADFDSMRENVEDLQKRISYLEGKKASDYTVQGDSEYDALNDLKDNATSAASAAAEGTGKFMAGCATVIGWIIAILIIIGIFLPV
tara:strand:- start:30 stop:695 length:666 start_codon:yes stop_codon:yes gene_type:complete